MQTKGVPNSASPMLDLRNAHSQPNTTQLKVAYEGG